MFQSCNEENESGTTRFSNERGFRKYILCWGFVAVPKSAEAKILNVRDVLFPSFKFYRQKLRVRTRLPESLFAGAFKGSRKISDSRAEMKGGMVYSHVVSRPLYSNPWIHPEEVES